ncbi:hypothetical protein EV361DRAFT_924203 [Lentinula raphanica]|nr:hypothetical protein EV361DRAFT_924203 [Lentinula raphanica]
MKFIYCFLLSFSARIVAGAPLPKIREVVPVVQPATEAEESYDIFYTGPGCPPHKPCKLTSEHWEQDSFRTFEYCQRCGHDFRPCSP